MKNTRAKHIVLNTFGSLGDLNPYIALARGLQARGHRPVIATSAFHRDTVQRAGIGFCPVRPDLNPDDTALLQKAMVPGWGTGFIIREMVMPAVRDAFRDLQAAAAGADMLVTHPLCYAGHLLARQRGLNWVSTVLAPINFLSAYDGPVLPLPFSSYLTRLGPRGTRFVIGLIRLLSRPWSRPIRRLRADLGLAAGPDPIFEGQFAPDLVLAMFSPVLAQAQPDWPPNTRISGYAFYDDCGAQRGLPFELVRFLEKGPPPLVFTLGSVAVYTAGPFYGMARQAAEDLGMRAVLLVGQDAPSICTKDLPRSMIAVDYAPFSQLFPRAAAIVHHGGIGTCGQALRAGRPMLVVPIAHDQPDNARRLQKLGAALSLPLERCSAARMARALEKLLHDPFYRERATKIGQKVRREDGQGAACDAIEERLAATSSGQS